MGVVYTLDKVKLDTPRIAAGQVLFVPFKAETIKPVIDPAVPAIERCLAAKALPLPWLRLFYGRAMAYSMHVVARRLCPKLVKRAREAPGISMRLIVHAAYGRTPEDQVRRWDDYILRAIENRQAGRPVSARGSFSVAVEDVPNSSSGRPPLDDDEG